MSAFGTFFKKELMEHMRTYKVLIWGSVCILFGMMSPLMAKLTPFLLEKLMTEGITIVLPEPVALDAWTQFFKNMSQIGCIVLVLLFSGVIAHETAEGTLIPVLTKGLSRNTVILAKYAATALLWSIGYVLCILTCYAYTVYVFGRVGVRQLGESLLLFWIFGLLLLAILMLSGTIVKSIYGTLLLAGGAVTLLFVVNMIPDAKNYNPISLATENIAILKKEVLFQDLVPAIGISCLIIFLSLVSACVIFQNKEL